jgi:tetratricopeptide (TPR) repeat protein
MENTSSVPPSSAEAKQALKQRDYSRAIDLLEAELKSSSGEEKHALLGLAYFQTQQYALSAQHYAAALEDDPGNADYQEMLALTQANANADVQEFVPEKHYFERDELLAPPQFEPLPKPPRTTTPPVDLHKAIQLALGNALGFVGTKFFNAATKAVGWFGYRDAVWTNWYHRPKLLGILTLAHMRDVLNEHNLGTSYPKDGNLTGFVKPGTLKPPPGVAHFRTADGSWNNLSDPKEGAAGTRFLRNVEMADTQPETGEKLLSPNPRVISRTFFTREGPMKEVPFLNMLAACWIQFMNSDWINHGEIHFDDFIEVPLPEDDPARRRYQQENMHIGRTQADPTRLPEGEPALRSAINEVTHWWDGSQIYGSDQQKQNQLRSFVGGKLRINEDGTLPLDRKGIEETGFVRNWWVGQSMLHTLFVREHNAICDHLESTYQDWDDDQLFNVARLINAAVMAKIHTVEWTPAILPNPALDAGLNANWYGLLTNLLRRGKGRKTVADINVHNPELGGVVGNPINKHGQGFGLTEEFVEIYRLHSLLPENLALRRRNAPADVEQVPFPASRQAGSAKITRRYSMSDLLFSFGTQHPGQLVLNNYPKFMQELSIPGNPFFDMGTVDIVRARERGVPRYNEFRRQLGLNPIRTFLDLTDDAEQVRKLKEVYGSDHEAVERLDLLVGTLAEGTRPTAFGFGETMFQVFILNATRRLQADRFYTDSYNEKVYTPEGLQWIDDSDFKTVILRHHPELADTGIANIRNAFEPWDDPGAEGRLRPERHPLRAHDTEIKGDPWVVETRRRHA